MSFTKETTVWCDTYGMTECLAWARDTGSIGDIRQKLHRMGWTTISSPAGVKDLCPDCSAKAKDKTARGKTT